MTLRVTKNILWTASLVYNWKKTKPNTACCQIQSDKVSKINKEIKTKTKHGNTITVLASLSDTIKTEMHFWDEPRLFVTQDTQVSILLRNSKKKKTQLNCQNQNTCIRMLPWEGMTNVSTTQDWTYPVNRHSLLCRQQLQRAWQVGCPRRRKSVMQIIICCAGQSEMADLQVICETLIQNPLPHVLCVPFAAHTRWWALALVVHSILSRQLAMSHNESNTSSASVFLPAET